MYVGYILLPASFFHHWIHYYCSVRFFGIDWLHIFRVSYNLQQGVDAMAKLVINDTSTTPFADILLPRYDNFFSLCLPLHCLLFTAIIYFSSLKETEDYV